MIFDLRIWDVTVVEKREKKMYKNLFMMKLVYILSYLYFKASLLVFNDK